MQQVQQDHECVVTECNVLGGVRQHSKQRHKQYHLKSKTYTNNKQNITKSPPACGLVTIYKYILIQNIYNLTF